MRNLSTEEIKLLNLLDENSNTTNKKLAKELSIPEEKLKSIRSNLEKNGIILKYKAIINWEKIESPGVIALIQVTVTPTKGFGYDEVAKVISSFFEVKTCFLVSGAFDLLVEVEGSSLKEVSFFIADRLATIEGVKHTRTNFLLKRYKQGGDILVASKTHRLPVFI